MVGPDGDPVRAESAGDVLVITALVRDATTQDVQDVIALLSEYEG